jgi:hypothetical protein
MPPKRAAPAEYAEDGGEEQGTAVRIVSLSAAQNKRGKNCYEGGMAEGNFTWYKDMGGNSNWMYLAVTNATHAHLSLALWLLYEAATEPLVDPLCTSGDTQVGFFNQSKNLNRQVPLFELAEESKPALEMRAGEAATLKVRINDLSSHHQNQRFILVAGPADAPIRGTRSVPIEIMSKPRVADAADAGGAADDGHRPAPRGTRARTDGDAGEPGPAPKRTAAAAPPLLAALAAVTDPSPTPARQVDLACCLLDGLPPQVKAAVADRLARSLDTRTKMALLDALAEDVRAGAPDAQDAAGRPAPAPAKPRVRFKSLAKANVEFKRNEKGAKAKRETGFNDSLGLSAEQLESFFSDDGGAALFNDLTPRSADGGGTPAPPSP